MALSYVTYPGNGVSTNFSVTFGYIATDDVKVYVDGVLKSSPADYTWFNSTTIQFSVAPANGTLVRIERHTKQDARWVDFQDAGNLTEADLDLNSDQVFYLVQEGFDNFTDLAMNLTPSLTWDALNHRIVNVADPTAAQDAVTKNWAETSMTSTLAQAIAAKTAADADVVLTHADVVTTNANAAATAGDAVSTAADAASTAADALATAADAAATAADAIATAADRVQTGLDAAATAADAVSTAADAVSTAADAAATAADKTACDADVVLCDAAAAAAAASAASLNLPDPITALQFLRGNAGGTAWEQFNLFATANTWTNVQQVQAAGGSFIIAKAYDVAHDSAFQGHLTKAFDGSSRGFFGTIPSDPDSYITAYTWNDTLGTPAWNRVFGANRAANSLQLGTGNIITYNGIQLGMLGNAATWSATQTFNSIVINGGTITGILLAVADGGTGATTAAGARTNLGLGSLATLSSINNGNWSGTDLAVINGGTGASDAATARTNLGLGSLATLSSISNSNWSGTDLAVVNGGTGASDATTARANLGIKKAYGTRCNSSGTLLAGVGSTSRISTGRFRFTHNVGGSGVIATANIEGAGTGSTLECQVSYTSVNAFDVYVRATSNGALVDAAITTTYVEV